MKDLSDQNPLVSIICVTFNHEKFIRSAIEGFLMQKTDFPFEILIHDDASTDQNQKVIEEYAEKNPHLIQTILQTENQYSKIKRITPTLLPKCKGKYIALCEGDDYWTDSLKLQKQVDFLEKNPQFIVCHHGFTAIDENENVIDNFHSSSAYDYSSEQMALGAFMKLNTLMFRNVNLFFPPSTVDFTNTDTFLISQLSKFGEAKYLPDIKPSVYRIHDGGIWSKVDEVKKLDSKIKTFKVMRRYADKKYSKKFRNRIFAYQYSKYAYYLKLNQRKKQLFQSIRLIVFHPIQLSKLIIRQRTN